MSFLSESILIIFIVHVMTEEPCQHVLLDSAFASKELRRPETVEVLCPRLPGATTIGNQLQDGDRTDGWPNLTTQS